MTKAKETDYEIDEMNVFAAIGRKDADELVAGSELLDEVGNLIEKSELTQHEVAKKLGIKQSKVSMLINGHLSEFSTDTLLHLSSCSWMQGRNSNQETPTSKHFLQ